MIAERWDILDENGTPTGKTTLRGRSFLKTGEYHLVVHIWPFDKDGRLLIQRRSGERKLMPNEWAATGGSAVSGEESLEAALRELNEEIGIAAKPEELMFARRLKRKNSFLDVWFVKVDVDINNLKWYNMCCHKTKNPMNKFKGEVYGSNNHCNKR